MHQSSSDGWKKTAFKLNSLCVLRNHVLTANFFSVTTVPRTIPFPAWRYLGTVRGATWWQQWPQIWWTVDWSGLPLHTTSSSVQEKNKTRQTKTKSDSFQTHGRPLYSLSLVEQRDIEERLDWYECALQRHMMNNRYTNKVQQSSQHTNSMHYAHLLETWIQHITCTSLLQHFRNSVTDDNRVTNHCWATTGNNNTHKGW